MLHEEFHQQQFAFRLVFLRVMHITGNPKSRLLQRSAPKSYPQKPAPPFAALLYALRQGLTVFFVLPVNRSR